MYAEAPCQGFSTANRQRIIDDPRNSLYRAYLQFLQYVRPKFFVMENVVGMAKKLPEIKEDLANISVMNMFLMPKFLRRRIMVYPRIAED